MVFFVCEGCNETLKKNKVDAHAARCRNCWAVSCVDCSVVFEGNDYAAHTSCISEAEKYEGSLYQDKAGSGKKAKKRTPQERWMDAVQSASSPEDSKLQDVLTRLANYDNVPRKKAKFLNFVKNSITLRDTSLVERAFEMYEAAFKASAPEDPKSDAGASNGSTTTENENEASKKRPAEEEATTSKSKKVKSEKPIKWAKLLKAALKAAEGKQLETKVLRDQVLAQIQEKQLSTKSEKELKLEFKAALKASDRFTVVEVVRLQ